MADLLPTPKFSRKNPMGFGTRQIYAYTDEDRYEGRIARGLKPRLKIGGTDRKVARDRIDEQDGTSQPVALVQKKVYNTTFWDTGFHKWLEERGYVRVRKNREWFEISVEDLDKEIEAYSKHLESSSYEIKGNYTPRTLQTKVSEEVCNRWNGKTIIQPLDLCPRFGKDFTHLDIFQRSKFRVMVIASYWLGSNESLIKTVNNRLDVSADIEVIKPDYDLYVKAISEGKRVLIDVSLHVDSDNIDSRLLDALKEEYALIVVDEADYGAWTDTSRSILKQYTKCGDNIVLLSTGSNIERAMIGAKGDIQRLIHYSYVDMLELKHQGDPTYKHLTEIACLNLDANDIFFDIQNSLSAADRINNKKIFSKRNTHIQRNFVLQNICDEDRGNDLFGVYLRHYRNIDHLAGIVWIPGTKEDVDNIAKVTKSIAPHYNVIALHSDDHTNRGAEKYVKNSIKEAKKNGLERTIIYTCGMGARSFSVPNVVFSLDCFDGGGLAPSQQRASRCLTPGGDKIGDAGYGKQGGLIVNWTFHPERCSTFELDLITSGMKKNGNDTDAEIRRVYGLVNFLKDKDTFMTEVDFREYITHVANMENLTASSFDFDKILSDDFLRSLLKDIKKKSSGGKKWTGDAWVSKLDKALTYIQQQKDKGTNSVDPERKVLRDLRSQVMTLIKSVGNASYLAPYDKSFKGCLETISKDENKNHSYKGIVGMDASIVLKYFYPVFEEQGKNVDFDLIILNNVGKGNYIKFNYEHYEHPSGFLQVPDMIKDETLVYIAKEPCQGVLDELAENSSKKIVVLACQEGYVDFYNKMGYDTIILDEEVKNHQGLPALEPMNFYGLGNPPFGNDTEWNLGGSSSNPLWWQIAKSVLNRLQYGGYLNLITPTNFVNGGDHFTELTLGENRKYDLLEVNFDIDKEFKVGIPMCRWILRKTLTNGHKIKVNGDRMIDADNTLKIYNDPMIHSILNRVFSYKGSKLTFNTNGRFDIGKGNVRKQLQREGSPIEWANRPHIKLDKDDIYKYPINDNGNIGYSRVSWKMNGTWRLFVGKMQNPLTIEISKEWEATGSTYTMIFDSEEEALLTQKYMTDPKYMWIVEQTRVSGRINQTTLSKFPNAPIEDILTDEEIKYIESHVK